MPEWSVSSDKFPKLSDLRLTSSVGAGSVSVVTILLGR